MCEGIQRAAGVTELLGFTPHSSGSSDVLIEVQLMVTDPLCSFVVVQMRLSHTLTPVTQCCSSCRVLWLSAEAGLGWGNENALLSVSYRGLWDNPAQLLLCMSSLRTET